MRSNISWNLLSLCLILALPNCMKSENHQNEVSMDETTEQTELDETTRSYKSFNAIKLFIYPTCPYCKRVIDVLREQGNLSKVTILDASIPKYQAELKSLNNNNSQCPFIYDSERNVKMLESRDIIKYFSTRFTE